MQGTTQAMDQTSNQPGWHLISQAGWNRFNPLSLVLSCRAVQEALERLQERAASAVAGLEGLQLDAGEEAGEAALQALHASFCPPLQRLSMLKCHRQAAECRVMRSVKGRVGHSIGCRL